MVPTARARICIAAFRTGANRLGLFDGIAAWCGHSPVGRSAVGFLLRHPSSGAVEANTIHSSLCTFLATSCFATCDFQGRSHAIAFLSLGILPTRKSGHPSLDAVRFSSVMALHMIVYKCGCFLVSDALLSDSPLHACFLAGLRQILIHVCASTSAIWRGLGLAHHERIL